MGTIINKADIQVLTHCDPSRALRACLLATSASSDVEVICAVNGAMDDVLRRVRKEDIPLNLLFVPVMKRSVYPANVLRNAALSRSTAGWVFYVDVDFVFSENFWPLFVEQCQQFAQLVARPCFCPIALWDPRGFYLRGARQPHFLDIETSEFHEPPRSWSDAREARLFKGHQRCIRDPFSSSGTGVYEITAEMRRFRNSFRPAEPWGLLRREDAAWADEDFAAGPMDKQQFVAALLDRGLRFFVVPEVFIFHLWHPKHRSRPDRNRNMSLWLRRHNEAPPRYVFIGAADIFPPKLVPAISDRLEAALRGSPPRSPDSDRSTPSDLEESGEPGESDCLLAMARGDTVVIGPEYLPRSLLGSGYRICLFFSSPSWYRHHRRGFGLAEWPRCSSDGYFINSITRLSAFTEATALIDNIAMVCDVRFPSTYVRALRNLLGIDIPDNWTEVRHGAAMFRETDYEIRENAKIYPLDYQFYEYLHILSVPRF